MTKGNLQGGAPTKIYSFVVVSSEGELSGYIDLIPFSSQLTAVESLIGGNFSGNLLASFNGYYIRSDLDGFDWKWLVLRGGKVDGTGQPGLDMLVLDPVCDEYSVNSRI